MTSPFPGMDPYLEGYLWPDVHNMLAAAFLEMLNLKITPKYVARLETRMVRDTLPGEDIGIMYPDVEVVLNSTVDEPQMSYSSHAQTSSLTVSIPKIKPVDTKIPVVEIKDRASNRLVTAIEILSPINKRAPGLEPYLKKRKELSNARVHLLEIDLIRRGKRPVKHRKIQDCHYTVNLTRAGTAWTDVWGFSVKDTAPIVPVPLAGDDPDVVLDLGEALKIIYKRSMYHLSINYKEEPPKPPFDEQELAWMQDLFSHKK